MNHKDELAAIRGEIDNIDNQIIALFQQRMQASEEVAKIKSRENIAVTDSARQEQILKRAVELSNEKNRAETISLMQTLMALSKMRQNKKLSLTNPAALESSDKMKENPTVSFQGVAGAWSEQAARKMFVQAILSESEYFEDVFKSVSEKSCDYGVLPIENSQTGAIGEIYDLLRRYNCYIIGETRIPVRQCLLGVSGASQADIREVYSHPEGFNQCGKFLKNKNWDLTSCRNTAYAAKLVSESNNPRFAAIGSQRAAEVYCLDVLACDISDNPKNATRFIAIAAHPIYDQSCGFTAITFSTEHKSGALCAILQSFMSAGINLTRIESRPVSGDKYRFFVDLQGNILNADMKKALELAAAQCEYFEILGCYNSIGKEE